MSQPLAQVALLARLPLARIDAACYEFRTMIDLTPIWNSRPVIEVARLAAELRRDAAKYRSLDYQHDANAKMADRLTADADELEAYLLRERGTAVG